MSNKTLAIFGVVTYILMVFAYAEDLVGNYAAPVALVLVSTITTIVFTIMATRRLWKTQRTTTILFVVSSAITLVLTIVIVRAINTLLFFWVVALLFAMAKQENKVIDTLKKSYGLTPEESSTLLEEKRKGNEKSVEKMLATAQKRAKTKYKKATGVDVKDIVPEIGKEISWVDVVNHALRVLEFDRNDTTIDQNNQVKAKSSSQPYGYLLAESPILNNKVRIPIIHRDDFLLAASVFDEPKPTDLAVDKELLVTYAPKHLLPKGISGSPHHVLHYAITPHGTLDSYYSMDNDKHMAKPDPQKLFGPFVYKGEIKVQINSEPKI